jgi:ATP synthase protein I
MADDNERRKLDEIGAKIDAAKDARKPKRRPPGKVAGAELGWRLTVELVAAIAIGAAIGWGLDSLANSKPLFLIVFVLFGFAAGVRTMLSTVAIANRTKDATPASDGPDSAETREEKG